MKTKLNKKGISLIVLVVTIAVVLVLVGAVILRMRDESITQRAMEVKLKNNITVIKEEWETYLQKLKTDEASTNKRALDLTTVDYDVATTNTKLPSISSAGLEGEFRVEDGDLVYIRK